MNTKKENKSSVQKSHGRVYTPEYIVENILDLVGYYENKILSKHIIDNSCGDGAFLTAVVDRYCKVALLNGLSLKSIRNNLGTYIHGIEIDSDECNSCIKNLNQTVAKFNISDVNWDIICGDALRINQFNKKMDYVVGNPPYVRVHNFGDNYDIIKEYSFAQGGMADLYLVFYEIGLKMLNENGVLGYITPSSFFNSLAGKNLREHLIRENLLRKLVNLKHFQAFSATTYTTIVVLSNTDNTYMDYYEFDEKNLIPYYVDTLQANDYYINGKFYFSNKEQLKELKKVLLFDDKSPYFQVKNGFATLADSIFIGDFDFEQYVIPIIKASTGKKAKCFFPYKNGKLVDIEELKSNLTIKCYIETNETKLKKRSLENKNEWFGFGRSQGINDVNKTKYSINSLLRTENDIKIVKCKEGTGVYSGLYILTDLSLNEINYLLISQDFVNYISLLGKYKSGGYYTFSSKDLQLYLNYKYFERTKKSNGQLDFFTSA